MTKVIELTVDQSLLIQACLLMVSATKANSFISVIQAIDVITLASEKTSIEDYRMLMEMLQLIQESE